MSLLRRVLEILGLETTSRKSKKVRSSLRHKAFRQSRARHLLFEQVEERRVLATVSAAAMVGTVTEGGTAVVYFNVSPPSSSPITVNWHTVAGTATENVDYQGTTGTATIGPNQSFASVSITTLTDSLTDSAETFSVAITGASGATVGTDSATITINDGSGGSGGSGVVSVAAASSHVSEGTSASFTLTLSPPQATAVTVSYHTTAGSAIENTDYEGRTGSATIPAGQTSATVSVPTFHDFVTDEGETFSLQITSASGASVSPTQNTAPTIIDDVPFVLPTISVTGGTIEEGGSLTPAITVDSGTATGSYTLTINWGDGSQATYGTTDIPSHIYVDDNPTTTPSDNYTISVTAIWPNNGPTATNSDTVTVNNIAPQVSVEPFDPQNPETPGGEIADGGVAYVRIYITDLGVQDTHTLHIAWGDESDETISVTSQDLTSGYIPIGHLYPPMPSAETTYPFQIEVTVTDDDGGADTATTTLVAVGGEVAVKPEVWIEAVDSEASEVKFDPGSFKIHRSGDTTSALVVRLEASGSASPGYDYSSAFGSWHGALVTIPAGSDSTMFTLTPEYDSLDEPTEYATFTIVPYLYFDTPYTIRQDGVNTTISIADGYGVCTINRFGEEEIVEDINAGVFWGFNYSFLQFEVILWGSHSSSTWTFGVTFSGSATKGTDYSTDVGANVQIQTPEMHGNNSPTHKQIYIYPIPDAKIEGTESVVLSVGSSSASGQILDDDDRTLKVTISESSVAEGTQLSNYVPFSVERVGGSTKVPLDVDLSTFGDADNYLDFVAARVMGAWEGFVGGALGWGPLGSWAAQTPLLNTRITFAAGQSVWYGFIQVHNDLNIEPTETIGIKAAPANSDEANVNADSQDTMTLFDNDLDAFGAGWDAASVPQPTADNYLNVTLNNGTQSQWIFNSDSHEWERVKKVYGWKAIDSEVVVLTNPGSAELLDGDSWSGTVSQTQTGTVQLGGSVQYVVGVSANAEYSLSQELAVSIGGPWDPNHKIVATPNVRWGGVRLIQTIQFVKQFKHDDEGTTAPPNGAAGEVEVTREDVLTVFGIQNGVKFYTTNTATIIFKKTENP